MVAVNPVGTWLADEYNQNPFETFQSKSVALTIRQAIKLDEKFGPAYANLADLYRAQGMDQDAGKVLRD